LDEPALLAIRHIAEIFDMDPSLMPESKSESIFYCGWKMDWQFYYPSLYMIDLSQNRFWEAQVSY
jgi:hypothetical protein